MGFVGSMHCIGMCGPLIMAVPFAKLSGFKKFFSIIQYHLARSIAYGFIGAIVGVAGWQVYLSGYQNEISILSGVLILVVTLFPFVFKYKISNVIPISMVSHLYSRVLKMNSIFHFIFLGFINGLLPCGLVYSALIAAVSMGSIETSFMYMFYFGMGTLPAMYLISVSGNFLQLFFKSHYRWAVPFIVSMVAVLLILRGLSLGIPYISPIIHTDGNVQCH
jgi:sulfite exporter TauE/SafE